MEKRWDAIPIIMGQNIGTCVTALILSVDVSKNAKRVSVIHVSFNVIGTAIGLIRHLSCKYIFDKMITPFVIANMLHVLGDMSIFPITCLFADVLQSIVRILQRLWSSYRR